MSTLQVKVLSRRAETDDIICLELGRVCGGPLPAFSAGAHIDVYIKPGIVRQYSLCNHPDDCRHYAIGVLREPASRGGSVAVHDELSEGDLIEISEPRNHFPLVQAQRTLLLAGGIGVTPMLCMAERLAHSGADFSLHYCTRSVARTAFRDRIAKSSFADRVQYHVDDGPAEQKLDLVNELREPDATTHIYVCGPAGFIDYVCSTAKEMGWSSENIHFEYFAGTAVDNGEDREFDVKLASTGKILTIPVGQSVTSVLQQHGVDIHMSCEQGVCGTCVTRVLAGVPDHRDLLFTDEERAKNDQFTPCCSRAKSDILVLDL